MCLCCSLTLQRIPASPAPQAGSGCSLQGSTAVSGCLDPPLSLGMHKYFFGSPWFVLFCFVFVSLLLQSISPGPLSPVSSAAAQGRGGTVGSLPCCSQPFLALDIEKKEPLVLAMPFMSSSSMTKKRTWVLSQRNLQSSSESVCWHHFFYSNGKRSERSFFFLLPIWSREKWAIWAVAFFTISLKSTQVNCLEKGRSWQSTQGPTGWAVKGEAMLSPCLSWCWHLQKMRKAPCPWLGIWGSTGGLLVSLQGHEMCVSVHLEQVWGLCPKFKSVLNSDLEFSSMVWLTQFGDSSGYFASGPLQITPVISHPGVIRGKVSKGKENRGVLSLSALWGMCASSLWVISQCLTVRGNFQFTHVSSYPP